MATITKEKSEVKAGEPDRDAVFGRFVFRLGRMVNDAQTLTKTEEFAEVADLCPELDRTIGRFLDTIIGHYEPLLTAYAESREKDSAAAG